MVFRFLKAAIALFLVLCIAWPLFPQSVAPPKKKTNQLRSANASGELNERQKALHALHRLTFVGSPGTELEFAL